MLELSIGFILNIIKVYLKQVEHLELRNVSNNNTEELEEDIPCMKEISSIYNMIFVIQVKIMKTKIQRIMKTECGIRIVIY